MRSDKMGKLKIDFLLSKSAKCCIIKPGKSSKTIQRLLYSEKK